MAETIRIFQLIKSLGRGGAEVLLAEGLRAADQGRFTYGYGYFLPWKDAVVPELKVQGADVVCFTARNNLSILLQAWRVAQFLQTWRADLVHCHLDIAGVVGRLAGRLAGVPVVYTQHNRLEDSHPITRSFNLATWRLQDHSVAVSEDVASSIRRCANGRVPVRTVLNGIRLEAFDPTRKDAAAVKARLGIPAEAPVVGTVAVFTEQKKMDDWLRAARRIHASRSDVAFVIVGDGPLRGRLEGLKSTFGLDGIAHFAGFQKNVKPYLAAMDVYMMSSRHEGLPIALLEAMAMERPVVSTAVGGIPDVLCDETCGALVPKGNVEELAEVALRLVEDDERRASMGRAARARVKSHFSMTRMSRELEALYLEVLQHRKARSAGKTGGLAPEATS